MNEYTLVVTSCNRHDLLKRTLESFAKFADVSPKETIVIEDSNAETPEWWNQINGLGYMTWLNNGMRRGQTFSIDKAYANVDTPLIFHCEDDWEFFRTGFILESIQILDKCSEVSMVGVRGPSEHPEVFVPELGFSIRQKDWNGWGGISWNPGLRRLSDYTRIGKYGDHAPYDLNCREHKISTIYRSLGFYMASLPAACKHIGAEHKVWDRAVVTPKILVAVPACHKYHVGNLAHENYAKHNGAESNDQVEACRESWINDLKVDHRFFYGQGANREPFADEVFLDVPDDYRSLPQKLRAICKWALEHGYEYIFKCDDDTYVWPDRLFTSGFEQHDYIGYDWSVLSDNKEHKFAGGFACWFSAKAARVIVNTPTSNEPADDLWVGHVLREAGIALHHDPRYHPNNANKFVNIEDVPLQHPFIAIHACSADTIRDLHERAWILTDAPLSNTTGFEEAVKQNKSIDEEVEDLMGGLQV